MQFLEKLEIVRKHRDIKLIITKARRNNLVLEPNYQTTKSFSDDLITTEIQKLQKILKRDLIL